MRLRPLAVGAVCVALLGMIAPATLAQTSGYFDPDTMMSIEEMQPGLRGVCRTVFQGSEITEFNVEIVRVLRNFEGPAEMVLFRVLDGPLIDRTSSVPRGMSGSPLYFNGKLAGAASRAVGITREPLAAFTPIEYMLECFDEMDRQSEMAEDATEVTSFYRLDEPLVLDGVARSFAVDCAASGSMPAVYSAQTLPLVPISMPLVLSGVPSKTVAQLSEVLAPRGFDVMQGVTGSSDAPPYTVEAGSAIGIGLMTGDFSATGGGTITYVDGDRYLAFGHPMFGDGKVDLPATYMDVADFVVQDGDLAEKLLLPIDAEPMGSVTQDRNQAIGGTLGTTAPTFPVSLSVDFPARGIAHTYNVRVATDEFFAPMMCAMASVSALGEYLMASEDYMVTSTIRATSVTGKTMELAAQEYSGSGSVSGATMLTMDAVSLFMTNVFSPEDMAGVHMDFQIEERKASAQLLRMELDDWVVEAGDTVDVKVIYRLIEGQGEREQVIQIPIDPEHPTGMTLLQVAGGYFFDVLEMQTGVVRPTPTSLEQLIQWYQDQVHPNTQLVAMMPTPKQSFLSGGVQYPAVPAEIGAVLASAGTTDYSLSAEARILTWETEYDIIGTLSHPLVIVRPEDRYAGAADLDGMSSPAGLSIQGMAVGSAALPSHPVVASRVSNELWSRYLSPRHDPRAAISALGLPLGGSRVPLEIIQEVRDTIDGYRESWLQGPPPPGIHMPDDAEPGSVKPIRTQQEDVADEGTAEEGETEEGEDAQGEEGEEDAEEEIEPLPVKAPAVWTQSSADDFLSGHLEGSAVLDSGAVALAANHQTVAAYLPNALYAWSLAPDGNGGVLVGTGPRGAVYGVGDDGKPEEFLQVDDAQVFAIEKLSDGTVLAGTGPKGMLYHADADGTVLSADTLDANYIWDILPLGDEVLVATGPDGMIYRGKPGGAYTPFVDTLQDHVLCMAHALDGDIYFGTDAGLIYRVAPDAYVRPVGSSPLGAVYDITVAADGQVYFSSAGNAYRIDGDGQIHAAIETSDSGSFALESAAFKVFLGTSEPGKVWSVDVEGKVNAHGLLPHPEGRTTDMILDAEGTNLWVLSTDPIVLYRIPVQPSADGIYMSRVLDAGTQSEWLDVDCVAMLPEGTVLTIETRSGNEPTPNALWSEWCPVGTGRARMSVRSPAAQYLQYRIRLESEEAAGTPVVDSVEVRYVAANRKPSVSYDDPSAIRYVKKEGELSWDASDPDSDTLRYHLYYSADQGATWSEIAKNIDETSHDWDVSELEPGRYDVRIVADDTVSNPGRGLTDEVIVGPIYVDNVAPTVTFTANSVTVAEDGTVTVQCSAGDAHSGLKVAQYKLDDEAWMPIASRGLIFRPEYDLLQFTLTEVPGGERTLKVAVFDMAGNSGSASVTFTVPGGEEEAVEPEAEAEDDTEDDADDANLIADAVG